MCSWAGLPGHVLVTVRTDPVQVTDFRANLGPRVYQGVPGIRAEATCCLSSATRWSR